MKHVSTSVAFEIFDCKEIADLVHQLVVPDGRDMMIPSDESRSCVGHLDVEKR